MSDINTNWLIENFGDKAMSIFDIGCAAVDGDAAMFKQLLPNATIYAFECADVWKERNTSEAKRRGINYFHIALSDSNETVTFYPSATYNGETWPYSGSICKPNKTEVPAGTFVWGEPQTVNTMRLDTFCSTHDVTPNFIHMDVQGAEYKVLSNIGNHRPWAIWAEVNEFENCYDTNTTYTMFSQLLQDLGYIKIYSNNIDELYVLNKLTVTPYNEKQK